MSKPRKVSDDDYFGIDFGEANPVVVPSWWVQGENSPDPAPRLLTDVHQLHALRAGAIIMASNSEAYRKQYSASGSYWARFDVTIDTIATDIPLPAAILHELEEGV